MRYIRLERIGELAFQISQQSHRDFSFNEGKATFQASNGLSLSSCDCPEVRQGVIFLLGRDQYKDDTLLYFRDKYDVDRFLFAVNEYNSSSCQCISAILCKNCMSDARRAISF